ncbi:helix-turn-helix domain-containing protein [Paracidovorax citrulli]|uniref:helix-turn-helix domain-containing protein n=1 Tax=Paracidovorax citrulli TaxID=80869 RepID=UPI003EB80173
MRARIVLACAEPSTTNRAVAAALGVSPLTVAKWRRRFAEMGLAGLQDAFRCGAPRTISDEQVEAVITTRSSAGSRSSLPGRSSAGAFAPPVRWRMRSGRTSQ